MYKIKMRFIISILFYFLLNHKVQNSVMISDDANVNFKAFGNKYANSKTPCPCDK